MKKIIGAIVVLIAITYSSFWLYEANKSKAFIENIMQEANIVADRVEVSGYPFYYEISIENPVWVKEGVNVSTKGKLNLSTNITGSKFWVFRDGHIHVENKEVDGIHSFSATGQSEIIFELHDSHTIDNVFKALALEFTDGTPSLTLEKIKSVALKGKDLQLEVVDKSDVIIFDLGSLDLAWSHSVGGKFQSDDIRLDMEGFQMKHNIGKFFNQTLGISNTLPTRKANLEFEGTFTYPKEGWNFFAGPGMSWDIKKFNGSSSVGKSHMHSALSMTRNEENQEDMHFDLVYKGEASNPEYQEYINELYAAIRSAPVEDDPAAEKFREFLVNNEEAVKRIIPKFDELSPLSVNINIDASSKKNAQSVEDVEMNIKNIDITMAPYSIYSAGQLKVLSNQPEGIYTIRAVHYKKMMQDFVSYMNNFIDVVSKFEPENKDDFRFTPKMLDGMLAFFREVSDEPKNDTEELHITVTVHKDGTILIGNVDSYQALEKWGKIFEVVPPPEQKKEEPAIEPAPLKPLVGE